MFMADLLYGDNVIITANLVNYCTLKPIHISYMGLLQERYKNYREPQKFMKAGVYPYFREITGKQGTEVQMEGHNVLMFGSNAYTGLTGDPRVEAAAKDLGKSVTDMTLQEMDELWDKAKELENNISAE